VRVAVVSWGGMGGGNALGDGGGERVPNTTELLADLNNDVALNATNLLNSYINDDDITQQLFNSNLSSEYYDVNSFTDKFSNSNEPLFISVNIQSLNSKFNELKLFINDLNVKGVYIDLIILQETWAICNDDLLQIDGYQNVIFKSRVNMRGGGVGIYVKKGLSFKIRNDLNLFRVKTFENIAIELCYPNKNIIISNIYHSPNPPRNCSLPNHMSEFLEILDGHLNVISDSNKEAYIFLDANIDLLKLEHCENAKNYLDACLSNGFLQLIMRATRIQGNHFSLIDHILTNASHTNHKVGTILSDLSDHFINFIQMPFTKPKTKTKIVNKRCFSQQNVQNFKNSLGALNWMDKMTDKNEVDDAFKNVL